MQAYMQCMEKPSFENDYTLTDRFDKKRSMLLWVSALGVLLAFSTSSQSSIAGFGLQVSPSVAQIAVLLAVIFYAVEFGRAAWLARILNDHLQRDFDHIARRHRESELLDGMPAMLLTSKANLEAMFEEIEAVTAAPLVQVALLDAADSASNVISSKYYGRIPWSHYELNNSLPMQLKMTLTTEIRQNWCEIESVKNLEENVRAVIAKDAAFSSFDDKIENVSANIISVQNNIQTALSRSRSINFSNHQWHQRWTIAIPLLIAAVSASLVSAALLGYPPQSIIDHRVPEATAT